MNTRRLLVALLRHLSALLPLAKTALLLNLALMVLGLAQSPNCHLSTLATVLPIEGQRENLIQRLRRWLKAPTLSWERYYRPLVRQFLANWQGLEIALVMDRTDLNDRLSLLFVGIATEQRVVLLAWEVLPYGGTAADTQIGLLKRIQPVLPDPTQLRISFFGDAEFRAVELQRFCQEQHWHWQVGVKSDTLYQDARGVWKTLRSIPIQRGGRRYIQQILLTEQYAFGPVNLIIDWNATEDQPRYWVLDQKADRHAWRRGRKRFWIEPTNRDLKSAGFDLEQSALPDPARLSNLVLAMAVTWLWMVYVGHWVIRTGRRPLLEAPHKHDYSRFRLGRDWGAAGAGAGLADSDWVYGWSLATVPGADADCARPVRTGAAARAARRLHKPVLVPPLRPGGRMGRESNVASGSGSARTGTPSVHGQRRMTSWRGCISRGHTELEQRMLLRSCG